MVVIGFRCFPHSFSYVVMEGTQLAPKILVKDKLDLPVGRSWGEKLVWLRKQVFELLEKHKADAAAVKPTEPNARQKSLPRAEVEGVVKEAVCAKLGRECDSRIKIQLRKHIQGFSDKPRYLERVLTSRNLDDANTDNFRDAALVAMSVLPPQ